MNTCKLGGQSWWWLWIFVGPYGQEFWTKNKGLTLAFSLSLSFKKKCLVTLASVDMHHLHLGLWGWGEVCQQQQRVCTMSKLTLPNRKEGQETVSKAKKKAFWFLTLNDEHSSFAPYDELDLKINYDFLLGGKSLPRLVSFYIQCPQNLMTKRIRLVTRSPHTYS